MLSPAQFDHFLMYVSRGHHGLYYVHLRFPNSPTKTTDRISSHLSYYRLLLRDGSSGGRAARAAGAPDSPI